MSGPPGTGKTLLAKACAGESGVPFFFISGSDFVEMYVGVGASRVRDLFKEAKEHSPAIVFIDEIDAIGKQRSGFGSSEMDSTLNQMLVEMDGFGSDENVVVFAATNRKDILDSALTRPGRFDRNIEVTLPDVEARTAIYKVHLESILAENKDEIAKRMASLSPGMSGADIRNVCNEAAISAARREADIVETSDFENAIERVIGGLEKKTSMSKEEKRIVAVHESGHAVVSWFLEYAAPLLKLTIIPRSKGSLGFAQYLQKENSLETKDALIDRIAFTLGGRCAEEAFFEDVTTGAQDDFSKAYQVADTMVTKVGMGEKLYNLRLETNQFGIKGYSDATAEIVDEEIERIVNEAYQKCKEIVEQHKDKIEELSNVLLQKETLDLKQIKEVLGERPFGMPESVQEVLRATENKEATAED